MQRKLRENSLLIEATQHTEFDMVVSIDATVMVILVILCMHKLAHLTKCK